MEADIVELRQRGIKFTQDALRAATPPHGLRIGGPLSVRPVRNAPKLPLGLAGCGRRLPIGRQNALRLCRRFGVPFRLGFFFGPLRLAFLRTLQSRSAEARNSRGSQ
jgi:hypothetical protein